MYSVVSRQTKNKEKPSYAEYPTRMPVAVFTYTAELFIRAAGARNGAAVRKRTASSCGTGLDPAERSCSCRTRLARPAGQRPAGARQLGQEVLVANAREIRAITHSDSKSDQLDAEKLARYARVDPKILHPITHRSMEMQRSLNVIRATSRVHCPYFLQADVNYASSPFEQATFLWPAPITRTSD